MEASMVAITSCRSAYYKKLYIKMHYKELNQKLKWGKAQERVRIRDRSFNSQESKVVKG